MVTRFSGRWGAEALFGYLALLALILPGRRRSTCSDWRYHKPLIAEPLPGRWLEAGG